MIEFWQLIVYGIVGFVMAILSGIVGGGVGFITTPLLIFFGLTPAQAISSGKFYGLAATIGSLSGLRKYTGQISKRIIAAIMALAFIIGLLAPFIIKTLNSRFYQMALGIVILLMIPLIIYKKVGLKPAKPSRIKKSFGGLLLAISLFLQGVFSGGLGSLVNVVLMSMFGMTALEANITKRWSQLILGVTIIFGLIGSGLIVWRVVAVNIITGLAGSYIGGRIAVQKGDKLVVDVMLILMLASGLILIFEAL